jgi:hypothetical protein
MKKETLNEELNRIKKLMNFDISENSHDVLSENVIKTVNRIDEQDNSITKTLATVVFDDTFDNNYITPKDTWKEKGDQVVQKIQDQIKLGYKLENIQITFNGGASPVPATNIYSLSTPPKHDFGGLLGELGLKWEKRSDIDNRVSGARGSNIKPAPDNGKTGNGWLAKARGENLKKLLIPYISGKLGIAIPAENIIITSEPGTEKFVHATVTPKVSKPTEPKVLKTNYEMGTIGKGYSSVRIYNEKNPNGKELTFNRALLPTASATKQRTGTDPNKTFQGADFGRGPGVGVFITKKMMLDLYKINKASVKGLNQYGGDPAEFEQSIWGMIKYLNSEEGKKNKNYMSIPSVYKKPLNVDYNPNTEKAWQFIDPSNGKIIVKQPMTLDQGPGKT